jgi:hypothetical protein
VTRRVLAATLALLAVVGVLWLLMRPPAGPGVDAPSPGSHASARPAAGLAANAAAGSTPASGSEPTPGRMSFEGAVLSSATGAGVPGAEVTFSRGGAASSVRTGPGGAFRFEPPEPGRWQLATASAAGFEPFAPEWGHSPVWLDARPGEASGGVVVRLRPIRGYDGRVEDPAGRPVGGASVRVLGAATGDRALLPSTERATSAADGTFTLSAPDGATLEARHDGHAPGRVTLDFVNEATRRVTIRLGEAGDRTAAGTIPGRVLAGGAPVESALVQARRLRRGGPGSAEEAVAAQALSDADGRFTLGELDPGRYLLRAVHDGLTQTRAVVAQPGEEAVVELSRGGRIAGVVREAGTGRPLSPFRVEVRRGRGGRFPVAGATVVDPSGRFEIADVPPGPVFLTAWAPGHVPSDEAEVVVPDPPAVAEVELRVRPGGRVSGRVVDRATGAPLAGARVALEGDGGNPPSLLDPGPTAATGADGTFLLGGLPARTLSLLAWADGHHARIVPGIPVVEDGTAGPVEIRLSSTDGEEPRVELAGIGASLALRGRDALRVGTVVPGGGAAEAGIQPGDDILSVEGRPVSELGLAGAVDLIRGPEDTRVRLVVRRGDGQASEVWVWRRLVRG